MFPLKRQNRLDAEQDLLRKLLRLPKYMMYCLKPLKCRALYEDGVDDVAAFYMDWTATCLGRISIGEEWNAHEL